ncbi:MAG TPA: dienelactone hydrolase family protein [Oceanipulchritudo sp.]|nr:dienelactone hydrolase family protein [Oceanipulchritudo sp.]
MKSSIILSLLIAGASPLLAGEFAQRAVSYDLAGTTFGSTIVWEKEGGDRPGILMVPNWMGMTEGSLEKARKVAEMGFVVMMVDMYGVDVRPANASEAGAAAGAVRGDRTLMRARAGKALEVFRAEQGIPLKSDQVAAIGFCFGGGTVLELARTGADLDAVISFHGDLISPTLEADSANINAAVLVLHGADDPAVPQSDVATFIDTMRKTDVDWQLVQFADTVHSFTNPEANSPGRSQYNARSSDRAFEYMEELLESLWGESED